MEKSLNLRPLCEHKKSEDSEVIDLSSSSNESEGTGGGHL